MRAIKDEKLVVLIAYFRTARRHIVFLSLVNVPGFIDMGIEPEQGNIYVCSF